MRKDTPLAVEVPSPDRDKPAWVKVGVIAAVGFVVGIAWPRVVGVRLGPSAPGESTSSAASSASAAAGRAPEAPPASVAAKTAVGTPSASAPTEKASAPAATAPVAAAAPPKITVTKGNVLSCKTTDGEKKTGKDCGPVAGLDLVVKPRVQSIATCAGVEGQTGKLSLVVNADFNTGRFWYDVSKASNVPNLDAVTSCLKTSFHNTSVDKGVAHEHARYTVSYTAMLIASDGASATAAKDDAPSKKGKTEKTAEKSADKPAASEDEAPAPAPAKAAAGEAAVAWEVALVRDQPKVGGVVARLPRGTKVKLGSMKEGWYSIKFGDDFGTDGWVYRGAVGR